MDWEEKAKELEDFAEKCERYAVENKRCLDEGKNPRISRALYDHNHELTLSLKAAATNLRAIAHYTSKLPKYGVSHYKNLVRDTHSSLFS